jgi:ankyrin repeat protein
MISSNVSGVTETARSLIKLGICPIKPDAYGRRAISTAALHGNSELLALYLSNTKEVIRDTLASSECEDSFKHLVWHTLMACPTVSRSSKHKSRLDFEDCILRLLNAGWNIETAFKGNVLGFETRQPEGIFFTCLDIAALKQLPRIVKLLLLLNENSPPVKSRGFASALHYAILSPVLRSDSSLIYALCGACGYEAINLTNAWPIDKILADISFHESAFTTMTKRSSGVGDEKCGLCSKYIIESIDSLVATHELCTQSADSNTIHYHGRCPLADLLSNLYLRLSNNNKHFSASMTPPFVNFSWTPLQFAMAVRSISLSRMFYSRFPPVLSEVTNKTSLFLHFAVMYNATEVVELLLEGDTLVGLGEGDSLADFPLRGDKDKETLYTPLDVSIRVGSHKSVRALIESKRFVPDWHSFLISCESGYLDVALVLLLHFTSTLEAGDIKKMLNTEPDLPGFFKGETILHMLARSMTGPKPAHLTELILDLGANPRLKDASGALPLHNSIATGNGLVSKVLGKRNGKFTHAVLVLSAAIRGYLLRRFCRDEDQNYYRKVESLF